MKIHKLGVTTMTETNHDDGSMELHINQASLRLPLGDMSKMKKLWLFLKDKGEDWTFEEFMNKCQPRSFGGGLLLESVIRPAYKEMIG
jgi:hypothetical protein